MTSFDKQRLYELLRRIPKGRVVTYGALAAALGNPGWARAVGNALHHNPDGVKNPCYKVVNGKGDEIAVDGRGLPLLQVLQAAGVTDYSAVRAVADDSYHAEYTAAELTEEGRVVLLTEGDSFRIVAFGDKDSRRNVSGVIRLVVS